MTFKKISHFFAMGLFLFFFYYFQKANMFFDEISSDIISVYSPVMLFFLIAFYLLLYKSRKCLDSTILSFFYFEIGILIITLLFSIFSALKPGLLYCLIFIPILSVAFLSSILKIIEPEKFIFGCFIVYTFLFAFYIQHYLTAFNDLTNKVTNASYTLIYLLPLLLCSRSKYIKFLSIILTIIAAFLSLKRGSMLSLSISLLIYMYISSFILSDSKSKFIKIFITSTIIVSFLQIVVYFNDISDNLILERFDSLSDDKGSGRLGIYIATGEMIQKSDFVQKILGHGWDMVRLDSPFHLSAHNDHLEILYDFGIIVYIMYIYMYYKLIRYNILLIKNKSLLSAPMAMSLVIFFISSFISHVVIYPYYMTTFAITWCFIIMSDKINQRNLS